jgi:osmotically-inducible protein OsmY
MRKWIRDLTIVGCLALPMALLGAKRPSRAAGSRDAQRVAKVAREIQEAVAKDESLSSAGRNVKVMVERGVIILEGMVMSDAESQAILGKAESFVIQTTPDRQIDRSLLVEIENDLVVARL